MPTHLPVHSHHTSYYFLMKSILTAITCSDHAVDEITLEPLLSFAARYVSHPRYARLIALVAQKILDLYSSVLGQSDSTDELFLRLHRQVCTLTGHIIKVIILFNVHFEGSVNYEHGCMYVRMYSRCVLMPIYAY